jgi:hypothetical protein
VLPREILVTRWAVVRDGSLATLGLIQPDLYAASREGLASSDNCGHYLAHEDLLPRMCRPFGSMAGIPLGGPGFRAARTTQRGTDSRATGRVSVLAHGLMPAEPIFADIDVFNARRGGAAQGLSKMRETTLPIAHASR